MIDKILQLLEKTYPLKELGAGEYARQKISGMTFHIRRFRADGLGYVSVMTASGFFGLMKMDTLIITPTDVDMPLLSYDRVHAMGNDTLIFELYDTLLGEADLTSLDTIKEYAKTLPDHDLGAHWYDSIKLEQSLSKRGKKSQTAAFDDAAGKYFAAFLDISKAALPGNPDAKREKTAAYVDGLLTHGGPSTDVFQRGIGREKTADLFHRVLFSTVE